jgi:hypothetical protein
MQGPAALAVVKNGLQKTIQPRIKRFFQAWSHRRHFSGRTGNEMHHQPQRSGRIGF